ncbi:hypothetical protein HAZT_HAZT002949 [Hyalella azteca]|uniref:Carbonyl reductase [NADPH] 2-like n=1 Tax=Hyalella azteca TaxID=294128 RepID=A0A6A0H565_HYAAZ|nr:carbonyl reductase [NADPH] 2-like [Hyalella azteca]KAA0200089.1 hypothetical protein HAZT_HAZT002949 [Hyalella azteca]
MDFSGKRALVTGAGAGIGRQTALHLSKLGAEVFALSRTKSKLETLQQEDPKIKIIAVDVSDWDATRKAVLEITPIQLLVNNAATDNDEQFLATTQETMNHMFNVNVMAAVNISQVVVEDLIKRKMKGNIVMVSSEAGLVGFSDGFAYNMSKAALDNCVKSMAIELSPLGIRINSVNPGLVLTDSGKIWVERNEKKAQEIKLRTPMRRFSEISDVTNVIAFLLSDNSTMVNGHNLPVEGGWLCGTNFLADGHEN